MVRKLKLFELVGVDSGRPFSPFCWRTRMALAHKGFDAETIPWRYSEKEVIAAYGFESVPVLLDGDKAIVDSWAIANYLEDTYPDRPSLFGGDGGRGMGRMVNCWGDSAVIGGMFAFIAVDIHAQLRPVDQAYFRGKWEVRLGKTLEDAAANRDKGIEGFRRSLSPMRQTLRTQPFLGGAAPNYADYIVFGGFQWARVVSLLQFLKEDDPILEWRERLLDLFDGMARKVPERLT